VASTLRLEDLKEGILRSWQDFNIREADIAAGLMPWEEDVVHRFVKPGAAVLVVGCGSGRDVLPLVERGCHVTGVDPASDALRLAQRVLHQRQVAANLIEGFFEDVHLSGYFDVVMFSYYTYSYIPVSTRRIRVLRKAATHLRAGGHIVISYARMGRPRPIMVGLARSVGRLWGSNWRVEPGDHVSRNRFPNHASCSYEHAFQPEEIEAESSAADLRIRYRRDWPGESVVVLVPGVAVRPD
jgi:SAM-dependent methyltransferase